MVEQHVITNLQDSLIPGLDFSTSGNSAEYVSASKQVRFFFRGIWRQVQSSCENDPVSLDR